MRSPNLLFIPTYNERDNLARLVERIRALEIPADILLLDDASPDGTGELADRLAERDPRVSVIHRKGKLGIGSAHLEGIRRAYALGYGRLVTMDADFTHQPEDLRVFLEQSSAFDVVIGTRFVNPESLRSWGLFRRMVTFLAHFLTQKLLRMPYDASGAFRAYRLDKIPREVFDLVTAGGYDFFFQSLLILVLNGFSVKEVPINLPARSSGHSKMTLKDACAGLSRLFVTFWDLRKNRGRYLLPELPKTVPERQYAESLRAD